MHFPKTYLTKPYPKILSRKASPPNPYLKIHLLKTYLTNPYLKIHLPKTFPTNPYLKKLSRKTYLTNLTPKCYPDERTRLNLDKGGNRRVRAPELFREFRAASIFAHPTLGRGAFPSFVVCLKWAEVSGLRHGRAA